MSLLNPFGGQGDCHAGIGLGPLVTVKGSLKPTAYKDIINNCVLSTLWQDPQMGVMVRFSCTFWDNVYLYLHCWMLMASGFHCRGWCVCIESAGQRGMRWREESEHWVPLEYTCSSVDCPLVLSWTSHQPFHTVHCKRQKEIILITIKQVDLDKQ